MLSLLFAALLLHPATSNQEAKPAPKLVGKVRFEGERPEQKPLPIDLEKSKGCCKEGEKVDETDPTLRIDKDGGLANVVVTIDVPGAKVKPAEKPVEIDQKKCTFEPHVMVVTAGSKVVFLNSDSVVHNVHTYPMKNEPINKTTAPGGKEELLMEVGDRVKVTCDYHPWMSAWVVVTETPYYALTKLDGSFEISGLPAGTYSATFWHERLGRVKQEITIQADGSSAPLEVKMAEKKKKEAAK
jgi:plastocyanin